MFFARQRILKLLLWTSIALFAVAVVFIVTVRARRDRTFEAPLPALRASRDPAIIERGRYLAVGPAHCLDCHVSRDHDPELPAGGFAFRLPIGTILAPNLTPDVETGLGRVPDEKIARVLRHGVGPDGRALLPFMGTTLLSDEDVVAILSYLRSLPPVKNPVPRSSFTLLGDVVRAFVLEPVGPTGEVPRAVTPGVNAAYGEYLATSVANCVGCHTQRDLATFAAIGPLFAGGLEMEDEFVTPNLTPHPTDGWITSWSEETFVARFQAGSSTHERTPMPWKSFQRMTEDDLRALYRFLRSLPASPGGPKVGLPPILHGEGPSPSSWSPGNLEETRSASEGG